MSRRGAESALLVLLALTAGVLVGCGPVRDPRAPYHEPAIQAPQADAAPTARSPGPREPAESTDVTPW